MFKAPRELSRELCMCVSICFKNHVYIYICMYMCEQIRMYLYICVYIEIKTCACPGPKRIVEIIEHVRMCLILEYLRACVCRSANPVRVRVCVRLQNLRLHGYTFESLSNERNACPRPRKKVEDNFECAHLFLVCTAHLFALKYLRI